MKKFFLLIFVTFCGLIFYQIILGKNGLIEGYRVQREKEQLLYYKAILEKEKVQIDEYIKFLKKDPDALKYFAEKLGFFETDTEFIRIVDELEHSDSLILDDYLEGKASVEKLWEEIEKRNKLDKKIKKMKMWLSVIFYLFFGFFIVLIIFGVQKKDE